MVFASTAGLWTKAALYEGYVRNINHHRHGHFAGLDVGVTGCRRVHHEPGARQSPAAVKRVDALPSHFSTGNSRLFYCVDGFTKVRVKGAERS